MHMQKKVSTGQLLARPQNETIQPVGVRLRKEESPSRVWLLLITLLAVGLLIITIVSVALGGLFQNLHFGTNPATSQPSITTLNVQRTAPYASLNFTVLTAQYATSFIDDTIHLGPAIVRVNIRVTNKTTDQISVIYYDVLRLLIPGQKAAAPANILPYSLKPGVGTPVCNASPVSSGPAPGKSEIDCVDFPVPRGIQLQTLSLQLGSVSTGEFLVTIPFSGSFNPGRYAGRISSQHLAIPYTYYNFNDSPFQFLYHLTSVKISYFYNGMQSKAGQQFYILNFRVDNQSGVYVVPGYAYDYVRLIINGNLRTPVDSTLPNAFNRNARNVAGQVVFAGPPGVSNITIALLQQNGEPIQKTDVQL
jgi:hypothetical protein